MTNFIGHAGAFQAVKAIARRLTVLGVMYGGSCILFYFLGMPSFAGRPIWILVALLALWLRHHVLSPKGSYE